jgi:4-hydroxy-3-methylbut-2-enyl diphosphate reductase IspH
LKNIDIKNNKKAFISAGASTPDIVINPILEYLKNS